MITGLFNSNKVFIDGQELPLEPSLKIVNHSPTGFCWGYGGSGPSQLALALLIHFGATEREAVAWYQEFKWEIISKLPQEDFSMETDRVTDWLESRRLFANQLEKNDE